MRCSSGLGFLGWQNEMWSPVCFGRMMEQNFPWYVARVQGPHGISVDGISPSSRSLQQFVCLVCSCAHRSQYQWLPFQRSFPPFANWTLWRINLCKCLVGHYEKKSFGGQCCLKWGCPDALAPLENRELQQIASDVMCVRCGQHGRFGDFFFACV